MHARIDPPDDLLLFAAQQSGVVTAEQALGHGLTRASLQRLVDQGAWQRLTRGVFRLGVDMERDHGALLDGEVTLRYGWADVTGRPCRVALEVARL